MPKLCEILCSSKTLGVLNVGLARSLFLGFSPKSASYEVLLVLRWFVNMGPSFYRQNILAGMTLKIFNIGSFAGKVMEYPCFIILWTPQACTRLQVHSKCTIYHQMYCSKNDDKNDFKVTWVEKDSNQILPDNLQYFLYSRNLRIHIMAAVTVKWNNGIMQ